MGSNAGSPKFVAVPQMTDNIGTPPQVFKSLMIDFIKLKFSLFDKYKVESNLRGRKRSFFRDSLASMPHITQVLNRINKMVDNEDMGR